MEFLILIVLGFILWNLFGRLKNAERLYEKLDARMIALEMKKTASFRDFGCSRGV